MKNYMFYIEGLDREVWQIGISEKDAKEKIWNKLSATEKNAVVIFDCIDEQEACI